MKDNFFRIKRNIFPIIRGGIKYIIYSLNRDVVIGKRLRIGKGCEFVFHPKGCCTLGKEVLIGMHSIISVHSGANMVIGDRVGIGVGNQFICHGFISIGRCTIFGPHVFIYDHNHLFSLEGGVDSRNYAIGEVVIGENCWIGAGVIILKNVHIGNNCVIGAGSVVTKDIPNNSIAVGNPAKVIRTI